MHDPDIHILSTRQLDQQLIDQAAKHNIHIDVVPFIRIEPLSSHLFSNELPVSEDGYVVFTSSNAVKAVAQWEHAATVRWKVFCMGGATLASVKSLLPNASVIGTAPHGTGLSNVVAQSDVKKVIFFSGNLRREELPRRLGEKGIEVEEIQVYTTLLTSVHLPGEYNGLLFFSPSAVESYLMENTIADGAVLFAIGNTTAAVLADFNNPLVVSEQPYPEELINKVIGHFQAADKK